MLNRRCSKLQDVFSVSIIILRSIFIMVYLLVFFEKMHFCRLVSCVISVDFLCTFYQNIYMNRLRQVNSSPILTTLSQSVYDTHTHNEYVLSIYILPIQQHLECTHAHDVKKFSRGWILRVSRVVTVKSSSQWKISVI